MEKRNTLNLSLNSINKDYHDPTLLPCTYVIMDFDVSRNNVMVSKEDALYAGKTLKNKPIVAKYHPVSNVNANDDNFGSHEEYMTVNKNGKEVVERDTVAFGVFTSEGYITHVNVNGQNKEVLAADGVLWYSKYKDACDLLIDWYERGVQINMSCEYLYKNYSFIDGVEHHHAPIIFESHAILASEKRGDVDEVVPAYESAILLSFNEEQKFNRLIAQAVNQVKEDYTVEDNLNQDNHEEVESTNQVDETNTEMNEQTNEVNETNVEETEFQSQTNEVSYDEMRSDIRKQVKAAFNQNDYVWINELYQSHVIVTVDSNYDYTFYKFNYSLTNDEITVDLDSKVEVKEKRDWVAITNELEEKLTALSKAKDELEEKFNSATETIILLNSQIEELNVYREEQLNAQREQLLQEKMNHFASKFEAIGAKEKLESEEVQSLIAQSIEDNEVGKEALLSINSLIVDMIQEQTKVFQEETALMGLASHRKNLIDLDDNSFESRYKFQK